MTKTAILLTALALIMLPQEIHAQSSDTYDPTGGRWLSSDEILEAYQGHNMDGIFGPDDSRTGIFTETHEKDGRNEYVFGDLKQDGIWNIMDQQLCYNYSVNGRTSRNCMYVWLSKNCYFTYSSLRRSQSQIDIEMWDAVLFHENEVPACQLGVS